MEHTKDKPTLTVLLFSAVRAQIAMFLTGLALLFLFCAVAYSLADPDTVTVPLSLAALFAGGLAGGPIFRRRNTVRLAVGRNERTASMAALVPAHPDGIRHIPFRACPGNDSLSLPAAFLPHRCCDRQKTGQSAQCGKA